MTLPRTLSLTGLLWLLATGCQPPAHPSATLPQPPTQSQSTAEPAAPHLPPGPATCPHGLALQRSMEVSEGAPAYFYEDRPTLVATNAGAVYVYLDHDTYKAFIARLSPTGDPQGVTPIDFPTQGERSHVVGAVLGDTMAIASTVYYERQEADIELLLLDKSDHILWNTRIDPSPLLDTSPAIAVGRDEIALAWRRGSYPSADSIQVAFVAPRTGKVHATYRIPSRDPGIPEIVYDGNAYWVAWQGDVMNPGILLAQVTSKGLAAPPRNLGPGANPTLLPSPHGLALAYDSYESGSGLWFTLLDPTGAPKRPPVRVATHPDPMGAARKPRLAWDGTRFAVAYEVHFSASVFVVHDPEAHVTLVDPNGSAAAPLRLHAESDAGEMPAVAWTGQQWLVVYGRDRLQRGKVPKVIATTLTCPDTPPAPTTVATGPCDPRTTPAPDVLRLDPYKSLISAVVLPDHSWAALILTSSAPHPNFVRTDPMGKTTASEVLSGQPNERFPVLARGPSGFAAAWTNDKGEIHVMILDHRGARKGAARFQRNPDNWGAPALAFTPAGVVVAWAEGPVIMTALLDGSARVLRSPSPQVKPTFRPSDCALGYGPHGLALAFITGSDRTETSVVHVARLDPRGGAVGSSALVSQQHGFLANPSIIGTPTGFLVVATSPAYRDLYGIELGPRADVVKPERKWLSSYGFLSTGAWVDGKDVRIFGLDGKNVFERLLCP